MVKKVLYFLYVIEYIAAETLFISFDNEASINYISP